MSKHPGHTHTGQPTGPAYQLKRKMIRSKRTSGATQPPGQPSGYHRSPGECRCGGCANRGGT